MDCTYLTTGEKSAITAMRNSKGLITRHDGQGNHFTTKNPLGTSNHVSHKKDDYTQFCVDYKKVNAVTHKDTYSIPRVDDTLDTL